MYWELIQPLSQKRNMLKSIIAPKQILNVIKGAIGTGLSSLFLISIVIYIGNSYTQCRSHICF